MKSSLILIATVLGTVLVACGSTSKTDGFGADDSGVGADGTAGDGGVQGDGSSGDDGGIILGDAAKPAACNPMSLDFVNCSCDTQTDTTRACYTGDPKTRNVGNCKDGSQKCVKTGEASVWTACVGDYTPQHESCTVQVDLNCNGKVGCQDPNCATDPACNTGCTNGQTRPCYTGPSGTENVGTCKDGTQTCVNSAWSPTCVGQVTPAAENCCDNADHNCNGLAGCWDLFLCATASCCGTQCQSPLDTGCVCPHGSGDQMTCPVNFHDVHKGGFPGTDECCRCTTSDCNDVNCCGSTACGTGAGCGTCHALPSSCNGQVSADCDDFPEDCDEPCCLCSQCP